MIDDAMRAIEKENKRLKDILPKNFARPELDKRRLGDVVDLFTNVKMIEHGDEKQVVFLVRLRGVRGLLQVGGETALRLYRCVVVDRELRLGETRDRTQNQ